MKVDGLTNDEVKSHLQVCKLLSSSKYAKIVSIFVCITHNLKIDFTFLKLFPKKFRQRSSRSMKFNLFQKYRLHTRRPTPSIQNNGNPQAPQFVVVGGIWVPPPEYTAVAATTSSGEATGNGIYAPVATVPPAHPAGSTQRQQAMKAKKSKSEEKGSHCEGGVQSNSPATSSSTHTTTTSPVF